MILSSGYSIEGEFAVGDAFTGTGPMEGVWEIGVIDTMSQYICLHNLNENRAKWVRFHEIRNIVSHLTPITEDSIKFREMISL